MFQSHGSILERSVPIGHGEVSCIARLGEETEVRELILPNHFPLLFQHVLAPFLFMEGIGDEESKKSGIDNQIK